MCLLFFVHWAFSLILYYSSIHHWVLLPCSLPPSANVQCDLWCLAQFTSLFTLMLPSLPSLKSKICLHFFHMILNSFPHCVWDYSLRLTKCNSSYLRQYSVYILSFDFPRYVVHLAVGAKWSGVYKLTGTHLHRSKSHKLPKNYQQSCKVLYFYH